MPEVRLIFNVLVLLFAVDWGLKYKIIGENAFGEKRIRFRWHEAVVKSEREKKKSTRMQLLYLFALQAITR